MYKPSTLVFSLVLLCSTAWPALALDHAHAAFTTLLRQYVTDGRVDYAALQAEPTALRNYLNDLAAVERKAFQSWEERQQLAFLVNLYNASTLSLIIKHYPVESIKEIGGVFRGPWKQPVVRLFGKVSTLDALEHKIIRRDYPAVPEIHFALVCAAIGCPPLRSEAYRARDLNQQFAEQRRIFLADRRKNRFDPERNRLEVSPIFKWFAVDFDRRAGSVRAYLKKVQWPEIQADTRVRYTRYNWSLNSQ